ncbi:unnamed protein product [Lactuca saligna]|uniref:Uncharacterized protein n=1 Tax=Lactuca saligna TaxID=75948 RepID=A0AA35Z3X4_LACSI|nr:unnamed protein product [Lactuca saligna]
MLKKVVVRVINKVIDNAEFASEIQGVLEACESLRFKKGKRMGSCSIRVGEPEVPDPSCVARRATKLDAALSSLAETNFVGLFRLEELDYDDFPPVLLQAKSVRFFLGLRGLICVFHFCLLCSCLSMYYMYSKEYWPLITINCVFCLVILPGSVFFHFLVVCIHIVVAC